MAKDIVVKVGSYEKGGEQKGEWTKIGTILENDNGEFVILEPTVDLAGCMMLQRLEAAKQGKKPGDKLIASIFDRDGQSGGGSGGGGDVTDEDVPF